MPPSDADFGCTTTVNNGPCRPPRRAMGELQSHVINVTPTLNSLRQRAQDDAERQRSVEAAAAEVHAILQGARPPRGTGPTYRAPNALTAPIAIRPSDLPLQRPAGVAGAACLAEPPRAVLKSCLLPCGAHHKTKYLRCLPVTCCRVRGAPTPAQHAVCHGAAVC